jgi:hypothetical protein
MVSQRENNILVVTEASIARKLPWQTFRQEGASRRCSVRDDTLVISPESRHRRSAACCKADQTDKDEKRERANRRKPCSPKG